MFGGAGNWPSVVELHQHPRGAGPRPRPAVVQGARTRTASTRLSSQKKAGIWSSKEFTLPYRKAPALGKAGRITHS